MNKKELARRIEGLEKKVGRMIGNETVECVIDERSIIDYFKKGESSDPEIIGNVMRWKCKDYLEADFVPDDGKARVFLNKCGKKWTFFEMIEITDELACMRKKDQPIWVMVCDYLNQKGVLEQLVCVVVEEDSKYKSLHNGVVYGRTYCRLANIDDLKKAGIK